MKSKRVKAIQPTDTNSLDILIYLYFEPTFYWAAHNKSGMVYEHYSGPRDAGTVSAILAAKFSSQALVSVNAVQMFESLPIIDGKTYDLWAFGRYKLKIPESKFLSLCQKYSNTDPYKISEAAEQYINNSLDKVIVHGKQRFQ